MKTIAQAFRTLLAFMLIFYSVGVNAQRKETFYYNDSVDTCPLADKELIDGVYVGQLVSHHLWFDECDYLSDNYWWRCFVFAKSKDEVENKLEKLREPEFREDLAPMIYWDDEYDDMKVTDDITI